MSGEQENLNPQRPTASAFGCRGKPDALATKAALPGEDSRHMADVFAALANPARIEILRHISRHRHCGCKDLTARMTLAQSTISQHLKVLCEAGLIELESVPPRSRYSVNEKLIEDLSLKTRDFLNSCCGKNC